MCSRSPCGIPWMAPRAGSSSTEESARAVCIGRPTVPAPGPQIERTKAGGPTRSGRPAGRTVLRARLGLNHLPRLEAPALGGLHVHVLVVPSLLDHIHLPRIPEVDDH